MERGIPRVPPVLLQPIFSLNPVTRMCSRICSTWKLVHTLGLGGSLLFQEAFSRQCQFSEFFQKLSLSSVSFISHLLLLYGLDVLWSIPEDAFISLVLLSPAVGLEDLRLDDLVTGAAHHEVEVVVCWVVAKQVHIFFIKPHNLPAFSTLFSSLF